MVEDNGFNIDSELQQRIEAFARQEGSTPSDVVRLAFDEYVCAHGSADGAQGDQFMADSVFDRWHRAGLIGCIDDPNLPADLTTNPIHMDGFGRD